MATGGATIAEPLSPSGALFANPAGLAAFPRTTVSNSIGVGFGREHIKNDDGYNHGNNIVALIPDLAISFARANGWHYGVGLYGSVGMNYDFPADPDAGVDHLLFAECSIAGLPLAVAKRVDDRLWLGAELIPMLGYMRDRFHVGDAPFSYKLIGPGIQAMVGATWKPDDVWSIGLSYRTPGRVWMEGSDADPGGGRQDVDLEIQMPMSLQLGLERRLGKRLRIVSSVRWTDTSVFEHSNVDFEGIPAFKPSFVPKAKDEWRETLGARYAATERLELRAAVAYSNRIVGTTAVSPMVFDNDHYQLSAGAGYRINDTWTADFMAGVVPGADRDVKEAPGVAIAGRYETSGFVFILGLQRRY
jgi:long-chain fatty acid transport protein